MKQRERIKTLLLPNGSGPAVVTFDTQVSSMANVRLRAWIGNFGSSNTYIFETFLSLLQCQQKLTDAKNGMDGVCLSGSTVVEWAPDQDVQEFTVFFEAVNNSGQTQAVTIVIRESVVIT